MARPLQSQRIRNVPTATSSDLPPPLCRLAIAMVLMGTVGLAGAQTADPVADLTQAESVNPMVSALPITHIERQNSRSSEQVRANALYARGVGGAGVTVGIVDSGLRTSHQELRGARIQGYNAMTRQTGLAAITDQMGHGTHVATAIAARQNGVGMYGIAPDVNLAIAKVFSTGGSNTMIVADGLRWAAARSQVVNLSLGSSAPAAGLMTALREVTATNNTVIVAAAGNRGTANPDWPAAYASESWAGGRIIAVGAVDSANRIASFSNRAGSARNFYVVAPGVSTLAGYHTADNAYAYMSGTSMATPVVSGVVALLKQYWPQLKADALASIVFRSATDLGDKGVDAVYGWGLVNAEKAMTAFSPIAVKSNTPVPTTLTISGATASAIKAAGASGQLQIAAFDEFGRDFQVDLATLIRPTLPMGLSQIFGNADRQIAVSERVLDRNGSTLSFVIDQSRLLADRSSLTEGGLDPLSAAASQAAGSRPGELQGRSLAGMSWVQRFDDGSRMSVSTLGLQPFFGVSGIEIKGAPRLSAPAFTPEALRLLPGVTTSGYAHPLGRDTEVRMGVATGSMASTWLSQWGQQISHGGEAMMLELDRRVGSAVVGIGLHEVSERNAYLGGANDASMAVAGRGRTHMLALNTAFSPAPGLTVGGQFTWGYTDAVRGTAGSLVEQISGVRSQAFSLGAVRQDAWVAGDRLALTVSSPLRATAGNMTLDVATGADAVTGEILREQRSIGLGASARELLSQLDYLRPMGKHAAAGVSFAYRQNPGHVAGQDESLVAVRWMQGF